MPRRPQRVQVISMCVVLAATALSDGSVFSHDVSSSMSPKRDDRYHQRGKGNHESGSREQKHCRHHHSLIVELSHSVDSDVGFVITARIHLSVSAMNSYFDFFVQRLIPAVGVIQEPANNLWLEVVFGHERAVYILVARLVANKFKIDGDAI